MRSRFLLVFNPTAGPSGRSLLANVRASLESKGASVTPYTPGETRVPSPGEVRDRGYEAVIAAGGDGTVRELARALTGSGIPLGYIPMGTGNVLAHEIGLPRGAEPIANVLISGPVVNVEGARANGELIFLMAGAGFDGDVIRQLNIGWKRRVGKLAYPAPVLRTLTRPLPKLHVEVDGRPFEANWVVIANAKHYGGAFVLAPDADMRSGELTAILVRAPTRARLLQRLIMLPAGRLTRQRDVISMRCRRAVIRSEHPVATQVDGDPFGVTPLDVEAGGAPFRLIVPEGYARRELVRS